MGIIKKWLHYAIYYSPSFVRKKVKKIQSKKELAHWMEISKRTKVSKEEIEGVINNMPIDGKDVLLHTSMAKIGKMQGGPKWFCECLLNKIDLNTQTLLVSALPYRGRFKDYLKDLKQFDVRTAPIAMGVINERIADLPGAKRSVHPTHSLVAVGKNAVDYTFSHHLDDTPFSVHSPYYKLVQNKGKVILFGADLDSFTLVHVCEDLFGNDYPLKVYDSTQYQVPCLDENGKEVIVKTRCHNPKMGFRRDLRRFKDALLEKGIMTSQKLGESEVSVVDSYQFVLFYLEQMKKGNSTYGKIKVKKEVIDKIINVIDKLKAI